MAGKTGILFLLVVLALASTSAIQLSDISEDELNALLDMAVSKRNYEQTVLGGGPDDLEGFDGQFDKRGRGRGRKAPLEKCVNPVSLRNCMCDPRFTDDEPLKRYKVCFNN
ncbi:uncharacterized protein LOC121420833 [Lytechinus variegatus]|uniref:uncharacterized protein LOC121420807 n=1 Tax=Lytechinus variegatus TaxID=7654 RepID=UPI001BB20DF5|nr:uncharacterized protein LOC121420807 [Lytechinus variegatus]XP_041471395.1 uncharacterized protein LOC121420833 [Lytechinus variegatus]